MNQSKNVVIVGGGIGGLTAALGSAPARHRLFQVYDHRTS
jgi:thioredoxin reductase